MSNASVKSPKSTRLEKTKAGTKPLPTPPDGGYGWVIVFASHMINLISEFLITIFFSIVSS